MRSVPLLASITLLGTAGAATAQALYPGGSNWAAMAADRRASQVGDILTIVIFQQAQSSDTQQNSSRKSTDVGGSISGGPISETGALSFGGGFTGQGGVTRTEKFIAQISVTVQQVLPNGDLSVAGQQYLNVNGERTRIGVRGRVRSADIAEDNSVLSNRIADAQIDYDGRGFVSRSAKPGLINRIFSFLGLG